MTKLERVNAQIAKTKSKIAEQQEHLRELESQKIELENKDMLQAIRGCKLTKNDLMSLLQNQYEKEKFN